MDNIHLTLWQHDRREATGLPEDWGVSASASWVFRNTWAPFLRAGWCNEGTALYEASVGAGFGYVNRRQDIFGLGVNWGRPGSDMKDKEQWTLEVFYKYQATEMLAITFDIQQIVNPALNPKDDVIGFYGLRMRVWF
jgi:porin